MKTLQITWNYDLENMIFVINCFCFDMKTLQITWNYDLENMIFVINCHFEIGSKETFISAIYVNRSKTRFYSFRRVNES